MSRYIFKMPDLGEGTVAAEIVACHVKPGDVVKEEQVILDVMTEKATVVVALRTPWDAVVYPTAVPAIATYSINADSLDALARALAGEISTPGRSPVTLARG